MSPLTFLSLTNTVHISLIDSLLECCHSAIDPNRYCSRCTGRGDGSSSLSAMLPGVADNGGQDDDCGGGNFLAGYGILIQDESGDDEGSRRKKAKRGSSHGGETVTISTKSTSKLEEGREAWENKSEFLSQSETRRLGSTLTTSNIIAHGGDPTRYY